MSVESAEAKFGWLLGGRSLLWEAPISGSLSVLFDEEGRNSHASAKRRLLKVDLSGQGLSGCLPSEAVMGNAEVYQLDLSQNG